MAARMVVDPSAPELDEERVDAFGRRLDRTVSMVAAERAQQPGDRGVVAQVVDPACRRVQERGVVLTERVEETLAGDEVPPRRTRVAFGRNAKERSRGRRGRAGRSCRSTCRRTHAARTGRRRHRECGRGLPVCGRLWPQTFGGTVADLGLAADAQRVLQGVVRLALVQPDVGAAVHLRIQHPISRRATARSCCSAGRASQAGAGAGRDRDPLLPPVARAGDVAVAVRGLHDGDDAVVPATGAINHARAARHDRNLFAVSSTAWRACIRWRC